MNGGKLRFSSAFTIVELLVVVVVIGILATITVVSLAGISRKAIVASIQSDLNNSTRLLKLYQLQNDGYPGSVEDCPTPGSGNMCLKASGANILSYEYDNSTKPQTFNLCATNDSIIYCVTEDSAPTVATTQITCPVGYIVVPGSTTYNTSDFCVMKYEAKCANISNLAVGLNTLTSNAYDNSYINCTSSNSRAVVSVSSGYPITSIYPTEAITYAQTACDGCHLITEVEWMTIVQNVLSVASNWSGGAVGSGYIFSGHNDSSPGNALVAAISDIHPYVGTGNSDPSNQKRTLTLTNGEVIWDLAGNVSEWTNATISSYLQPGLSGESTITTKQWDNSLLLMRGLPFNSQPNSIGISGIVWNSSSGIGLLRSNYGAGGSAQMAFQRGGSWNVSNSAGVLALDLGRLLTYRDMRIGFRVAR